MKTWQLLVGAAAAGAVGYWLWKKYNPLGDPSETIVKVERVPVDMVPPYVWRVTKESGAQATMALPNNDFIMPFPESTKAFFANIASQPEGKKMVIGKWTKDGGPMTVQSVKTKAV